MTSATGRKASDAAGKPLRQSRGDLALAWWRGLTDPMNGDRGALAELRRCRSTVDAATTRSAVILALRLGAKKADSHAENSLDLARVLAHVKVHVPGKPVMRIAGFSRFIDPRSPSGGEDEKPKLSEVRFRRLLRTVDGEERVAAFARLVRLLGGEVPIDSFSNDFLNWNHPEWGDRVREKWAFDYYAAGLSAPDLIIPDTEGSDE